MTLYCHSQPCSIVCGSAEEGWAAIRFEHEEEGVRDVPLIQLKASDPSEEIYQAMEEANEEYEVDFEKHLPLRTRFDHDMVIVETFNNSRIYSFHAWETDDRVDDRYELVEEFLKALRAISMAGNTPKKFLFRQRDEL